MYLLADISCYQQRFQTHHHPLGAPPGVVARLLQHDLSVLSNWVALSKMKLNFNKSNVMWFNVKRLATSSPPILLNSVP